MTHILKLKLIHFGDHIQSKLNDKDTAESSTTDSRRNVLDLLGISDEDGSLERDRVALFVAKKELDEGDALQRIKWMMAVYRRWIGMKEAAQSGRCGFVEAVAVGMGG